MKFGDITATTCLCVVAARNRNWVPSHPSHRQAILMLSIFVGLGVLSMEVAAWFKITFMFLSLLWEFGQWHNWLVNAFLAALITSLDQHFTAQCLETLCLHFISKTARMCTTSEERLKSIRVWAPCKNFIMCLSSSESLEMGWQIISTVVTTMY